MIGGFHSDVLLAAAYALLLAGVAGVLERMALYSHRLSEGLPTAGFEYQPGLDVWLCPLGERLELREMDHSRRVATYRASAQACNACSSKHCCTDSDDGRQVQRHLDSWLRSELRRFHRGLSLALVLLAGLILAAEMSRQDTSRDWVLLSTLLVSTFLFGVTLLSGLRHKHNEPHPRPH